MVTTNLTLYYGIEYVKVFAAYMLLMFVWPNVVFKRFLKNKNLAFNFAFCTTTMVVLVNTVVLLFGLAKILNPVTIGIFFYGIFFVIWLRRFSIPEELKKKTKFFLERTMGGKSYFLFIMSLIGGGLKKRLVVLFNFCRKHKADVLLMSAVVIYGMIYFSYGLFQNYSYGFSDLYVHTKWIYGLKDGQVFSSGIYPEGLHCLVYTISSLFGIETYSAILLLASPHLLTLFVSIYIFLREVFKNRYTPYIAMALFLMIDTATIYGKLSMSRLQYALPQEFAFYAMFLCAAFALKYVKCNKNDWHRMKKFFWNDNLYIFLMALATTICVHFYPTIMAFFICFAFVIPNIIKVINPNRLVPIIASAMVGILIAIIPMGLAFASGIPFQGSIGWAMEVMSGKDNHNNSGAINNTSGSAFDEELKAITNNVNLNALVKEKMPSGSLLNDVDGMTTMGRPAVHKVLYEYSITELFGEKLTPTVFKGMLFAVCAWIVITVGYNLLQKRKSKDGDIAVVQGYLGIALSLLFFMILFCSEFLGLPELVDRPRLISVSYLLGMSVLSVIFDLVLCAVSIVLSSGLAAVITIVLLPFININLNASDLYHHFLYMNLTRYNEAVLLTTDISQTYPAESFTIVSPVDELYQVLDYGYHEELVSFINKISGSNYTLPTEYVFVFIEKKPLKYAQNHTFNGPRWLARSLGDEILGPFESSGNRAVSETISDELSHDPGRGYMEAALIYKEINTRNILESKANRWCQEFIKIQPGDVTVYFENDNYICYQIHQNTQNVFNLATWNDGR